MARRLSYEKTATSTILVLLVLLEAALVSDRVNAAPVQKRNDIVAGTEFLSVFINGAMAPVPVAPPSTRRRGYRRGGGSGLVHSTVDSLPAESRQSEASIYRISRAPPSPRPAVTRSGHRDEAPRLYPINQKPVETRDGHTTVSSDTGNPGEPVTTQKQGHPNHQSHHRIHSHQRSNSTETHGPVVIVKNRSNHRNVNQKVIGVSVTSTVEATPYKVRVEHHDAEEKSSAVTRTSLAEFTETPTLDVTTGTPLPSPSSLATTMTMPSTSTTTTTASTSTTTTKPTTTTSTTTTVTPVTAQLVTEELTNIVSESNRSEFSVDEGLPKTSWHGRSQVTTGSIVGRSSTQSPASTRHRDEARDSQETSTRLEPVERSYELPEENSEPREIHREPMETLEHGHQGRKAGRHYDSTVYDRPSKSHSHEQSKIHGKTSRNYGENSKNSYAETQMNYGEPARVYSEPARIYGEPSKIYGEPAKIYGEPAKIYGKPERVYGEPAKIYSEPARVYSEPAKVYGEPAKIYSEPSKIYGADGRPVIHETHRREPEEENYEVDEAVSVGSNGNVHGPQVVTEAAPRTSTQTTQSSASRDAAGDGHKVGYVVDERNYRKYRVEERTADGFIVGEYGVVSHDDGSLRGVRYTADGTIDPRLIYDALMKFLAL